MTYNPPTSSYYKEAKRLLSAGMIWDFVLYVVIYYMSIGNRIIEKFISDSQAGITTEHKQDEKKKEPEKSPADRVH